MRINIVVVAFDEQQHHPHLLAADTKGEGKTIVAPSQAA